MNRRCLVMLLSVASLAIACGGDDDSPSTSTVESPETSDVVGLANPASEFCIEQGGTLEIVDEPSGQVGYCNLPDGTRVEEWEYFRENDPASGG